MSSTDAPQQPANSAPTAPAPATSGTTSTARTTSAPTALVVRGGWDGHDPVGTTAEFLPFLKESGFDVTLADTPEVYADLGPADRPDLILQSVTMSAASHAAISGLRAAVQAGTGLAGWHGGIVDSFRDSSDYLQLVGATFAFHPAPLTHSIEVVEDHPITRGISSVTLTSEQYWVLSDPLNRTLAVTTHAAAEDTPWHQDVTSPAVYTRLWGKGRIFVMTAGHEVETLRIPELNTMMRRGMLWAAGLIGDD